MSARDPKTFQVARLPHAFEQPKRHHLWLKCARDRRPTLRHRSHAVPAQPTQPCRQETRDPPGQTAEREVYRRDIPFQLSGPPPASSGTTAATPPRWERNLEGRRHHTQRSGRPLRAHHRVDDGAGHWYAWTPHEDRLDRGAAHVEAFDNPGRRPSTTCSSARSPSSTP